MDIEELIEESTGTQEKEEETPVDKIHEEVEVYIHLLVVIFLIDNSLHDLATDCVKELINRVNTATFKKRTLDSLKAKAYFYYSRCYELTHRLEDVRGELLAAYRTAALRHDNLTQATLLNLLLRNYLEYNLINQAEKLVSKVSFKEVSSSSNEFARYLYYTGRIKAIQLDYTESYRCLIQATRKAPQHSAFGFRKTVHKLACIVQLLIGEIPEISVFRQAGLKKALLPYFELTKAVRVGDLSAFQNVVKTYEESFKHDKNYTLIQRLRRNVIKTGLRKINLSYSRISLEDIYEKLRLESTEDAEFIVSKAIRDGVIDATINHAEGYMQSRETTDIYSSQEPLEAFHRRISFCLNLHNDAVVAMRFPDKKKLEITPAESLPVEITEEDLEDELDDEL